MDADAHVTVFSSTFLPGGPERGLIANASVRNMTRLALILGGTSATLIFVYRTLILRSAPGVGLFASLAAWWANWGVGRRDL